MITDEPVRGSVAPPWFDALSGIDRVRAWAQGLVPRPPLSRLLGIRPAHVGAGSGTWVMPASAATTFAVGQLEVSAFIETALHGAALTALDPATVLRPCALGVNYFRPARSQAGNLLARARVANISAQSVFTEVEIEDADGRQLAHAGGHARIEWLDPPPPAPPSPLRVVDEPVYATPDPHLRAFAAGHETERDYAKELVAKLQSGAPICPLTQLYGARIQQFERGRLVLTVPASEWFCMQSRDVSAGIVASISNLAGWLVGSTYDSGNRAGMDKLVRFHAPVRADGRPIQVVARVVHSDDIMVTDVVAHDASGRLIASSTGSAIALDDARRLSAREKEARRVLATLLFTDIVGSTHHAERLGDERWRAVLSEHHALVRREIARCEGTEVKTIGDGFFARFESPARGVACARAVRDGVRRLGVEIRAGVHTGECEVHDRDLSGIAVHLAARIQAVAAPGEILVSGTVKDLTVGSNLCYTDRGEHDLKGVADRWRLFRVDD